MPCSPSSRFAWIVACLAMLAAPASMALEAGDQAPDFTLPVLQSGVAPGAQVSLSDYQDDIVYIDFWASWCGPCRQSLPLYEALHQELSGQGLQIVAINLDEREEDASRFLAKHPVSYTVLRDANAETPEAWKVKAMPTSYLLDGSGQVVRIWAGFKPSHMQEIRDAIAGLQRP
ncbi:MAG TPA: TlpA disulfide reductase family protein [Xanthomonadales bacterium]|nr:TlpA disulfide reductase family protein [Xanthomonadales bacterium]